jgi:hypothetical protein
MSVLGKNMLSSKQINSSLANLSYLKPASELIPGFDPRFDLASANQVNEIYQANMSRMRPSIYAIGPEIASTTGRTHMFDFANSSFLNNDIAMAHVLRKMSKVESALESFKDQIIIDLGAGSESGGFELACKLGARAYIAVEYCFTPWLVKSLAESNPENPIPYAVIYSDIAQVLEHLPSNSFAFFIAGIDDCLFDDNNKTRSAIERLVPLSRSERGSCLMYMNYLQPYNLNLPLHDLSHNYYLGTPAS